MRSRREWRKYRRQTEPINTALRQLGVRRTSTGDEFDTLALGQHRHTEDWPDDD